MGSLHNELTGRSGFISRAVRNAIQIDDAEKGIERLSETLVPTIDLWQRPEWDLLRGERIWGVSPTATALAANFSSVGVLNPTGSEMIVVVESVSVVQNNNVIFGLGPQQAFTATSTPNSRDSRTALLTGLRTVSFSNQQVAALFAASVFQIVNTATPDMAASFPIVLSPGFFFGAQGANVNTVIQVNFIGRERPAFKGELNARA